MDFITLPSGDVCICIGQEDNTISLLDIKMKSEKNDEDLMEE